MSPVFLRNVYSSAISQYYCLTIYTLITPIHDPNFGVSNIHLLRDAQRLMVWITKGEVMRPPFV